MSIDVTKLKIVKVQGDDECRYYLFVNIYLDAAIKIF